MSYFSTVGIDDVLLDAFNRQRTSSPYTVLDLKQIRNGNSLFFSDKTTGTGSINHLLHRSRSRLAVTSTAGVAIKQSKLRGIYQPGKSMLVIMTGRMGDGSSKKTLGYMDTYNGLFFRKDGGDIVCGIRNSVDESRTVTETIFPRSTWNKDKLNGTGPSRLILNTNKVQIWAFDFEWLGAGRVRFYLNIDGKFILVHEYLHANNYDEVYMSTPNLPIRYEVENTGSDSADYIDAICGTIISEGGKEDISFSTHLSRETDFTIGAQNTWFPLLGIRMKDEPYTECYKINPLGIDIQPKSALEFEWQMFYNPTYSDGGATAWSWQNPSSDSAIEFAFNKTNAISITGGYPMSGGYGSSTNQAKSSIDANVKTFLTLGKNIDYVPDEMVLAIRNTAGAGGSARGGVTVGEYI